MLNTQARRDEYEEHRLRESLTKLSNHCTMNQLSEFISGESGTETDDPLSTSLRLSERDDALSESGMSSSYEVIEIDSDSIRRTLSPIENLVHEYDIISSGNEDEGSSVTVKGQKVRKGQSNAESVKNARGRLQIADDDGISNALALFGKSDSSDTLINDSEDSDSDLDELVRKNQLVKTNSRTNHTTDKMVALHRDSEARTSDAKNEIISRTSAGMAHAQRTDSDNSADRTLKNSNLSECDITITLSSPDNITQDVFLPEPSNSRDENKNLIEKLNLNSFNNSDSLATNINLVEVNRVEGQGTGTNNDEIQELKNGEFPRQQTVARGVSEKINSDDAERGDECQQVMSESKVTVAH